MPTKPKTKPAAAKAPPISDTFPTLDEMRHPNPTKIRQLEDERQLKMLQEFIGAFGNMSLTDFEDLKTFKLILERERGCNTPVEEFLVNLIERYGWRDDHGKGLTVEEIKKETDELCAGDLQREIEHAHFMAQRYPLPTSKTEGENHVEN